MKGRLFFAAFILLLPFAARAAGSDLVIDSFQVSGDSAYDEFVTIRNNSSVPINLQSYTISRKTNTSGWSTLYKFGDYTLVSGAVIKVAHSRYVGTTDFYYSTTSYLSNNYAIAILAPTKPSSTVVDLVGYGDSTSFEGSPLPNPSAKEVFIRVQESDNNLADFVTNLKLAALDVNVGSLVISELLPSPDGVEEWFELYNQSNQKVSLYGLKVCDGVGSTHCYSFSKEDTIGPNEYKIYTQSVTKITLNNTGDWLELRDGEENIISDTGGNYGDSDTGVSLSIFGDVFQWTKTPTPGAQNFYTDPVEHEVSAASSSKKTSSKKTIKKASQPTVASKEESSGLQDVAGVATSSSGSNETANKENKATVNIILGYVLIILAVILLFGYNLWDKRQNVKDLYNKIRKRDDWSG